MFAASLFSAFAFAETWTGTLVDVMCKGKDLAGHTRNCALGCAKSGFAGTPYNRRGHVGRC